MSGLSSGETTNDKGKVLFVGRDIFLGTMVSQAVQKAGFTSKNAIPTKVFSTVAEDPMIKAIVVDLKEAKEALPEIVESGSVGSHPRLIAIIFHTDTEAKRQALKAGFEHLIHRSQIQSLLPQILNEKKI